MLCFRSHSQLVSFLALKNYAPLGCLALQASQKISPNCLLFSLTTQKKYLLLLFSVCLSKPTKKKSSNWIRSPHFHQQQKRLFSNSFTPPQNIPSYVFFPIASPNHYLILQQPLLRQHMATQNHDTWQKLTCQKTEPQNGDLQIYIYIFIKFKCLNN